MKNTKLLIVSAMLMASGLVHAEGANCAARDGGSLTSNPATDKRIAKAATSQDAGADDDSQEPASATH